MIDLIPWLILAAVWILAAQGMYYATVGLTGLRPGALTYVAVFCFWWVAVLAGIREADRVDRVRNRR